ncbi:hypothetical protein RS130_19635 [Paraglaciecola aquimarina]|uniref:Uncharacterized protein n=1 Tax=Paraglaciecola aquimarina TaxID=1235557 RepID=A0ABU3T0K7_9ALTE|nr:hypothetical protein [Paraglaciecola aquimarina]MDU0355803.1 hypothetical protein [Paraglaciecola aquimarina]
MNTDIEIHNEIAKLKLKVQVLEAKLQEKVEVFESDCIFEMVEFLNSLFQSVNSILEKSNKAKNPDESRYELAIGVNKVKEKLNEYMKEMFSEAEIKPETHNNEQLASLPVGISINVTSGRYNLKIDTDLIENVVVNYRYLDTNTEPLSGVVIRELCKSAIATNIHHAPRDRRKKIGEIYESRSFKDKLNTMLGYYPKFGVGDKKRILDVVSIHVGDKFPEIYQTI